MRPRDERGALEALRHIKKVVGSGGISEADLLEVLAWDDQPNNSKDPDPIHKAVRNACKALVVADDHYSIAVNILKHLATVHPDPFVRQTVLVDCVACGEPILGRNVSGMDDKCRMRWVRAGKPDRNEWIAKQRLPGRSPESDKLEVD